MPMSGFSVILVPTDGPEAPRLVLKVAHGLARPGARLIVARVGPDLCEPDVAPAADALRLCLAGNPPGDADDGVILEVVARTGPAAEAVVALAAELACELIVIGDDVRVCGDVERLPTCSVAQQVLRQANCPVLCLPVEAPAAGAGTGPALFASPAPDLGLWQRVD